MRVIIFSILLVITIAACRSKTKATQTATQPACKVLINFASRGTGIDYTKYEKLTENLKAKNLKYTEKAWGKEGEKEICIPLSELSGKEKTDFVEQLKTFEDKSTLVSVSVN